MSFTPDVPTTEDALALVLSSTLPALPPQEQLVGASTISWWETAPGEVYIHAEGGTPDDRHYASVLTATQLEGHGYRRAQFDLDQEEMAHQSSLRRTASWVEIMAKAKRLIQSGQVQVLRNGFNYIVGHVVGDHGDYDTEISRDSPTDRSISGWQCSCPWDQYAWQRCVMMGSMISLADGTQKPVEEIVVGDAVIDHTGDIGYVSEIHVEDWTKDTVTLRATGFDPITVKPDHPVWGVEVDQVKCRNKDGSLLKTGGQRAERGDTRNWGFCVLDSCSCRNPRTELAVPSFRLAEDFEVDDYLVRPHLKPVESIERLDLLSLTTDEVEVDGDRLIPLRPFRSRKGNLAVARQRKAAIPRYLDVNADLLRLFGYYVAEGFIAEYSVRFSFHREETEFHEDVRQLAHKLFGAAPRDERNGPNGLNICVNNREIASVFRSLFGTGSKQLSLPMWLMYLPPQLQMSFIEGWWLGDGHYRKSDGRYQATTTSSQLAHQLELLLQRQGFTVGLIHERRSEATYSSRKANESDAYTLYWHPEAGHNRGVRFSEGDNTMVRIEEVNRSPYSGKLYDLTIVGNPGYLVNGFSVHNTRKWKKFEGRPCAHVMALYWKALSTPLDEQLTPEQAEALGTGQKLPAPAVAEHPPEIEDRLQKGEQPPDKDMDKLPRSFGPNGEILQGDQTQMFGPEPPEAIGRPGPAQAPLSPPPSGPQPPGILPQFPGEQQEMPWGGPGTTPGGLPSPPGAYTVPGAKPQTPANPIQNPSTYSKVAGPYRNDEWQPGSQAFFEYRCHRGHDSNDADLWYRSHQPVQVLRREASDLDKGPILDEQGNAIPGPYTAQDRMEAGVPYAYTVRWPDGHEKTAMEDELLTHPQYWSPHMGPPSLDVIRQHEPNFQPYQQQSKVAITARIPPERIRRISKTSDFNAPEPVRAKKPLMGLAEGPVKGQYGDGEYREIPAGTPGEVYGVDNVGGQQWIQCRFDLPDSGPNEPYRVVVFAEPGDIVSAKNLRPSDPTIRRQTQVLED